ncbi:MAG: TIGR02099 family protein [Azoarcus sp.]|jgi:uncharacterized protein (TIGR02099 family)|nr:TIGR02099 family protein [Azoarcus sp.]
MNPQPPQPEIRPPSARRLAKYARLAGRVLLVLWFVLGGAFIVLRTWGMPLVGEAREWIAAELSHASGLPVSITHLEADWPGLRPRLHLAGLTVSDGAGQPVLQLERVDATLAWSSLLYREPHFHRLEISGPRIILGRAADGVLTVAGLRIEGGEGENNDGGNFVAWLLEQQRIVVRNAAIRWVDAYRGAPPLELDEVQFIFERGFGFTRGRFALRARPPAELASTLDVRGELRQLSIDVFAHNAGRLYVSLERANLGAWSAWVDSFFPLSGYGGLRLWMESDGDGRANASADVVLDGVEARFGPRLPPLNLTHLDGRLQFSRIPGQVEISGQGMKLLTGDNRGLDAMDFSLRLEQDSDGKLRGGGLAVNMLDLALLARLAMALPLDEKIRARLTAFAPRGHLQDLKLAWQGQTDAPDSWSLATRFENIGFDAWETVPGLGGWSGSIDGNAGEGRFALTGQNAVIDLPEVFEQSRLAFASLDAEGGWRRRDGRLELSLERATFANADAAGSATGRYWLEANGPGEIDLSAHLTRAEGAAVWRYLPRIIGPDTHGWIKNAIQRGRVNDTELLLKGRLADFPFRDGNGQFLAVIKITGARLDYTPGWPAVEDIEGELRFAGAGLTITARRARMLGAQLERVTAAIPNLHDDIMTLSGVARGPSKEFLRFIAETPLAGRLGFADRIDVEGDGQLDLTLRLPLRHLDATQIKGGYRFNANSITLVDGLTLDGATGKLDFTADTLVIPSFQARLLGEPVTLAGRTNDSGRFELLAHGKNSIAAIRKTFDWPVLDQLDGVFDWNLELGVDPQAVRFTVHSGLEGFSSRLPAPLAKQADENWPLSVEVTTAANASAPSRFAATLNKKLDLALERDAAGRWRGGFGFNQPVRVADVGIWIAASLDDIDIDAWRAALDNGNDEQEATLPLAGVALEAQRLRVFGQNLSDLKLHALSDSGGWKAQLASTEAQGELDWRQTGDGMVTARLRRLALGSKDDEEGAATAADANADAELSPRRLPGLDVQVDSFALGARELGQLEIRARNQHDLWQLEYFAVRHPEALLTGSGSWQAGKTTRTQIDFTLDTANAGHFLQALGYANTVRGGQAKLFGQLDWQGAPIHIDYPTLSGALALDASNGQFEQLAPGMGRLLGILSLQALPRRVTLDFRDVFSHGFVFDRIVGNIAITDGVMRTQAIVINGPAARARMRGTVDIAAETQDLRVNVQPTLAESVAIAAAAGMVNPVAGAVTYLGQKVLGDPIEKLFAYEYKITGNWADPVVEKVNAETVTVIPGDGGKTGNR